MAVHLSETTEGPRDSVLTIVVDGYNAPVSAGEYHVLVSGCASAAEVLHYQAYQNQVLPLPLLLHHVATSAACPAGQFVDLVQRKFYDGMEIQRADGFVVQTGDPDGPEDGFLDPATGKIRR